MNKRKNIYGRRRVKRGPFYQTSESLLGEDAKIIAAAEKAGEASVPLDYSKTLEKTGDVLREGAAGFSKGIAGGIEEAAGTIASAIGTKAKEKEEEEKEKEEKEEKEEEEEKKEEKGSAFAMKYNKHNFPFKK